MAKQSKTQVEETQENIVDQQVTDDDHQFKEVVEVKSESSSGPTPVRARRAFMLKYFLPSPQWILTDIVSKGKGTRAIIGRIHGIATEAEEKWNDLQGTPIRSIVIHGTFEAESYLTGEVSDATSCYFPLAYAEKILTMFAADKRLEIVEIDTDIGVEATGKSIPYEWIVIGYAEDHGMEIMKRIKNRRGKPEQLLLTPPK